MKIKANIEYPPRTYAPPELTLQAACTLLDAFILEMRASYEHINKLETVLVHCEEYFCDKPSLVEQQLLVEIKEVLPDED